MTTVAWDGRTLAADGAAWFGGARRRVRKVHRLDLIDRGPALVAAMGSMAFATLTLDFLVNGGAKPQFSDYELNADQETALVIDRNRKIWVVTAALVWLPFEENIFASGSGHEFAMGALEAGATAEQAVRIAMKRSDYAGLDVDTVSFDSIATAVVP